VSFVSVTQSFNTTSSMGRLTLNVLLSFAQLEREVIGERVRDKIAASKRKGIWVGGPVPLGYRVIDKKLVAVPEEAKAVRTIFERYLALGSIRLLSEDLAERGISPRPRLGPEGSTITGARFMVGPLGHILKNRCYIGEVVYQGQVHQGEHQPILDRPLFDSVQARLADGAINRTGSQPSSLGPLLLTGLLYDDAGNRMTPSHANKKGVRYRYYVSQAVLQNRKTRAGTITRVSAPEIEELVSAAIRKHVDAPVAASSDLGDRDLLVAHVQRVVLHTQEVRVTLCGPGNPRQQSEHSDSPDAPSVPLDLENERSDTDPDEHVLIIPWIRAIAGTRRGITSEPSSQASLDPRTRDALLIAIAKARSWMDDLVAGRVASFEEIAQREGKVERHVRLLAPLAFVSPKIITAIVNDCVPSDLTVTSLARALPHSWAAQEQALRIG
jgi:site-specific DNA recombinase